MNTTPVRPASFGIKGTTDQVEGYRRCLLVRAAASGGPIDNVPVFALSMGVMPTITASRSPTPS